MFEAIKEFFKNLFNKIMGFFKTKNQKKPKLLFKPIEKVSAIEADSSLVVELETDKEKRKNIFNVVIKDECNYFSVALNAVNILKKDGRDTDSDVKIFLGNEFGPLTPEAFKERALGFFLNESFVEELSLENKHKVEEELKKFLDKKIFSDFIKKLSNNVPIREGRARHYNAQGRLSSKNHKKDFVNTMNSEINLMKSKIMNSGTDDLDSVTKETMNTIKKLVHKKCYDLGESLQVDIRGLLEKDKQYQQSHDMTESLEQTQPANQAEPTTQIDSSLDQSPSSMLSEGNASKLSEDIATCKS